MQTQNLTSILTELNGLSHEIDGSSFVTTDGLVVASALPPHFNEDRVGAITAGIVSLSKSAFLELEKGHIRQIFVQSAIGHLLILHINKEIVLAVIAKSGDTFYSFIEDIKVFTEKVCRF